MKRRRLSILAVVGMLATLLPLNAVPAAAATAFVETFDDASGLATNTGFFSDDVGDYFGLTDGLTGDFGAGAVPSALKPYTGFDGSFMTGMDLDGDQPLLPVVVDWIGIDITGMSDLEFSGDFAEFFDSPGDIDEPDYIKVRYQIDGGGYTDLLWFSGADFTSTSGPFNGFFREDTDFDGTGDGVVLGAAALNFTKPLGGTGSVLDLRLEVFVDSGDEDFAVDNFVIEEGGGTTEPAAPIINEFSASTTGSPDVEYIEVLGDANTDYSAFTVVELEGDSSKGTIDRTYPVGTTDAAGFWITSVGDLSIENGSITLLLVEGFTGNVGDDIDADDDGVIDFTPWIGIADDVAVADGDIGDLTYASTVLGPNYDGVSSFPPGGASRIPNGTDTDTVADWTRNDFDLFGIPGFSGTPASGEAANTPGAVNEPLTDPVPDPDVLINEVDSDTPGTDTLEFIELYDGGDGNVALDGLTVVLFNGSDDKSYDSFDLDGYTTDADGYFVLGNSAVPGVDVIFGSNGLQNGADAVAVVVGDAADFPNDTPIPTLGIVDAIVYDTNDSDDPGLAALLVGGDQVNEDGSGDKDNHSNQRCPNGSGSARDTSNYEQWLATPGAENICELVVVVIDAKIHEVQGAGPSSPLVGQTVAIEGIVVGDFQDDVGVNGDLNGFHVQEEDADADSNPVTSEGIFVFNGSDPVVDVNIGDLVRVEGPVSEFNGLTEITSFTGVTVISSGNALPAQTVVTLPVASLDDFEAYEGMYVTFPQDLVISEYFNFDRFGEIVLTTDRAPQPTAVFEPGSVDAQNLAISNALSRITLDDGRTSQNPDPAIHPNGSVFDLTNTFRGGDLVANATGVMDFSFGLYKIQPTSGADYTATNSRPLTPDPVGSDLTVATFNVLNYFTTLDDGISICGPLSDQDCRGADNAEEFTRQRDKIIDAIVTMDADVVGLMEIENHPTDAALDDLVAGLNAVAGAGTYAAVATGPVGGDAIRVALIYQPASVTALGAFAVLDSPEFLDPNNLGEDKNRAALAQSFIDNTSGGVFTVAVNHLKSKGSSCGSGDDDPEQGSCNLTRTLAAGVLADWLETDPTGSMDDDFLIIGDLNSYDKEDPIDALKARGYADLVLEYEGEYAYSYVFSGQWGYLDYIMANGSMESQVTDATIWHINADEPDILDYDTSFKQDAQDELYEPNAFRSSDHDPVIIGLDLTPSQVLKETTAGDLADLVPTGDRLTDKRLSKAIDYINASLNSDWWSNENTIVDKKVFDAERQAIAELALVAGDLPEAATAIDSLLTADRQLALAELIAAIDRGGRESKIAAAYAALDDAAAYISAGMYVDAVNAYKAAWDAAHKA